MRSRQLQQALDPTVRGPQGARTDRLFRVDFLIGGNVKHLKLVQLVLIVALLYQALQARDPRGVSARTAPAASRQRRHKHRNLVRVHVVRNVRVCLAQEPAKVELPAGHFLPLVFLPSLLYFLPLTFKAGSQCACSMAVQPKRKKKKVRVYELISLALALRLRKSDVRDVSGNVVEGVFLVSGVAKTVFWRFTKK